MAGQVPDIHSLNSWEDAFQHPLPVVRKLEQQLRRNIDENRQKLRSLVGASYRDLLGTAERIIEMDEKMQTVESTLGDIGRRCNARTMERVAENHGRMRKTLAGRDEERLRTMAETKVLQNALTSVLRSVKTGGDVLQAAKLLVLARLLLKSVSESPHAPPVIEQLRQKLPATRQRLLTYIERNITSPKSDKTDLVHILCAYTLVTSSTPKEVLRYFLEVRYQGLELQADPSPEDSTSRMLDLYRETMLDIKELFPRQLADAAARLTKVPLLKDEQVRESYELNLDAYETWISPDIASFTPWLRHEQLSASEVSSAVSSWSTSAQECILDGIRNFLQRQTEPGLVVSMRQKVLMKYFSLNSSLRSSNQSTAIDDVRKAFLARLLDLATQSGQLQDLDLNGEAAVPGAGHGDMWEMATQHHDLDRGAFSFRRAIIQKRHGRNNAIQKELQKLDAWTSAITTIVDLADAMRGSKWDSDLDFELDDFEDGEVLVEKLNKQDPASIKAKLSEVVARSLKQIFEEIAATAETTEHAAYQLRLWRELSGRREMLRGRLELPAADASMIPLHRNLARSVISGPLELYVQAAKQAPYIPVTLWDGSPALPVQPLPGTFRFLVALHKAMAGAGNDLWTEQGVRVLKEVICEMIASQLDVENLGGMQGKVHLTNSHSKDADGADDAENSTDSEAHVPNGASSAPKTERLLQHLFDLSYLSRAFSQHEQGAGHLGVMLEDIRREFDLETPTFARVQRNAGEYWKRTYLLFGLLAPAAHSGVY